MKSAASVTPESTPSVLVHEENTLLREQVRVMTQRIKWFVLQRISRHPARDILEVTPRAWKTKFADSPLR